MTLPSSGPISVENINLELRRNASDPFSMDGVDERTLAGVPSGTYSWDDFRGKRLIDLVELLNPTPTSPVSTGFGTGAHYGRNNDISETHCIVGAPNDNTGGGTAYVFTLATGALLYPLANPNQIGDGTNDFFGEAVAISATHFAVGAWGDGDALRSFAAGYVYIYDTTTGTLLHTLVSPEQTTYNSHGWAKTVEINNVHCLIGEEGYNVSPTFLNEGRVHLYNNTSGSSVHTFENPEVSVYAENGFGEVIAMSSNHIAISNPSKAGPSAEVASGKVYIYNEGTQGLLHTLVNPNTGDKTNNRFGTSVSVSDSYCAIFAKGSDVVYIYSLSTGLLLHTLANPNPNGVTEADQFGAHIAISDRYCLVSAHETDNGVNIRAGIVYVYDSVTGAHVETINPFDGGSEKSQFGRTISINSTHSLIAAPFKTTVGGAYDGTIYLRTLDT